MPNEADPAVQMAETFGAVARALASDDDLQGTLQKIVDLAVEHLDACEYAGVSMVEQRRITSPASSNETPKIVDKIQEETGEGPCIDAIREHEEFYTGDLASEDRWPSFARRAHEETGVRSIASFRLYIEGDTMGALNLYSTEVDAFDESDRALGTVFAIHAAVAVDHARAEEGLERKAASRDIIGQAKGILMARQGLSGEEAFDLLRRASQRLNIKLTTVAEQVATGTTVPTEPPASSN